MVGSQKVYLRRVFYKIYLCAYYIYMYIWYILCIMDVCNTQKSTLDRWIP